MRPVDSSRFSRRSLAKGLGSLAAATLLPEAAASDPPPPGIAPDVETALAATAANLTPEERMDLRNGVRSLRQALKDARGCELPHDVGPAFIFLPEGSR